MNEPLRFAVIVEKGEYNCSAYSPDLPGCVATGNSVEETLENMKEATSFHLKGLQEDAQSIPTSSSVAVRLLTIG